MTRHFSPPALSLLLVLTGGGLPAAANPFTWQLIESRGRAQTELDLASVVRKEGRATGWVQHTYSKLTSSESGAYFAYRSMKEQLRMQCGERTVTVLSRAYFNDEGNEIAMIKGTGETRAVAPESIEQRVMTRMCAPAAARAQVATIVPAAPATAALPAAPKTDVKADGARIDAAKRIAGAPVAPVAPVQPLQPVPSAPPTSAARNAIVLSVAAAIRTAEPVAARASAPPSASASASATAPDVSRFMDSVVPATARGGFMKTKADAHAGAHADAPTQATSSHASSTIAPAAAASSPPHAKSAAHAPAPESRKQTVARVVRERARSDGPPHAPSGTADHISHDHAPWAYDGEFAPYRWGDMKSDFAACKSGSRQSPIDIRNPVVSDIEPIQFHYEDAPLKVSNNGHTIQVDYAPGSFILHGGARYELLQFHFHTPSEERINGRAFDMVAHLVHKSAQGKLAVVAVLLTAGKEQAMLQQVWNAMPGTANRTRERLDVAINAKSLLPADPAFYSFMGSLTTPPCTEGVQWLVMKTPVEISREQIGHFAALYPMNARPLQAQNDRLIKAGR